MYSAPVLPESENKSATVLARREPRNASGFLFEAKTMEEPVVDALSSISATLSRVRIAAGGAATETRRLSCCLLRFEETEIGEAGSEIL